MFMHIPEQNYFLIQDSYPICKDAVCHGAEQPYVFDSAEYANIKQTPAEKKLAQTTLSYWNNFGTGNLNNGMEIEWPLYSAARDIIVLDLEVTTTQNYRKAQCNFLSKYIQKIFN